MKSRTKPALRVVQSAQVQISLPVQGVLQDVKHAFYGLCIRAGREVLAQMLEADRVTLCGAKNVPDSSRVAAEVILTHCAEVKVIHLGEDDGLFGAVDVDPGECSGDTSDGPKGRGGQSDRAAAGVLAQHCAEIPA